MPIHIHYRPRSSIWPCSASLTPFYSNWYNVHVHVLLFPTFGMPLACMYIYFIFFVPFFCSSTSFSSSPSSSFFSSSFLSFYSLLDSEGTILSPSLCLPQSKGSAITQFHAALNLLSSLHTLSTNPPLSLQSLTGKKMKSFSVDDYHVISRFNS